MNLPITIYVTLVGHPTQFRYSSTSRFQTFQTFQILSEISHLVLMILTRPSSTHKYPQSNFWYSAVIHQVLPSSLFLFRLDLDAIQPRIIFTLFIRMTLVSARVRREIVGTSALVQADQEVATFVPKGQGNLCVLQGLDILVQSRFGFWIAVVVPSSHDFNRKENGRETNVCLE